MVVLFIGLAVLIPDRTISTFTQWCNGRYYSDRQSLLYFRVQLSRTQRLDRPHQSRAARHGFLRFDLPTVICSIFPDYSNPFILEQHLIDDGFLLRSLLLPLIPHSICFQQKLEIVSNPFSFTLPLRFQLQLKALSPSPPNTALFLYNHISDNQKSPLSSRHTHTVWTRLPLPSKSRLLWFPSSLCYRPKYATFIRHSERSLRSCLHSGYEFAPIEYFLTGDRPMLWSLCCRRYLTSWICAFGVAVCLSGWKGNSRYSLWRTFAFSTRSWASLSHNPSACPATFWAAWRFLFQCLPTAFSWTPSADFCSCAAFLPFSPPSSWPLGCFSCSWWYWFWLRAFYFIVQFQ